MIPVSENWIINSHQEQEASLTDRSLFPASLTVIAEPTDLKHLQLIDLEHFNFLPVAKRYYWYANQAMSLTRYTNKVMGIQMLPGFTK